MTSPIVSLTEQTPYQRWNTEITYANKELEKFHKRAERVVKKFLDERTTLEAQAHWFNLFYANVQILQSALYAQLPKPMVTRKYLDYKDDVARVAAMIIERNITQDLDDPGDNFDNMMRSCVEDRLVPGLAQAWLRLETETEEIPEVETAESVPPSPGMEAEDEEVVPLERITSQRVVVDYIYWKDFVWSPCRVYAERRWVGRKAYMTRDELKKRFGDKHGLLVPLTSAGKAQKTGDESTPEHLALSTACIYEIWDRVARKVIWLSLDYSEILDEKDDPLGLRGFEPCPEPMFANTSTSNTIPRPDYHMLQDQYNELDNINNRISMLIRACKVVGVYDKSATGIARMLTEGFDNQLIPVDNWAMFAEKQGLKGQIDWLPLEAVIQTIQQLNVARATIKDQIYELTGIADIVRGASKASETLGAQQIKAQFASVRIKKLQDEVARFASDVMRIKAEIQVKHFAPEILIKRSGLAQTDNGPFVLPAIQLLKDEESFEWRITISADTLAQADYAMEKADRIAFMEVVSKYMRDVGPMVGENPKLAPIFISILKWAVAGFRNARDIEGLLDKELDELSKPEQSQGPKPPTPDQIAAQAEQQAAAMEMKFEQQRNQMELQRMNATAQFETQRQQMELERLAAKARAEQQAAAMQLHMEKVNAQFEQLMQEIKLQNERAKERATDGA